MQTQFQEKQEIAAAVTALWNTASSLSRGDTFTWSSICGCTRMGYNSVQLRTAFKRFRKRLLSDRKITLRPVPTVGFRLLTHTEQVVVCAEDRHRKMFRQAQKAIKEVEAVDPSTLSTHHRKLQLMQLDKLRSERRDIRRSIREIVSPPKKTETIPKRIL